MSGQPSSGNHIVWEWGSLCRCGSAMLFKLRDNSSSSSSALLINSFFESAAGKSVAIFFWRQTDRQTDRQNDRQTEKQSLEYCCTNLCTIIVIMFCYVLYQLFIA